MDRRLPSLESLRVFEACARHANFTHAASELGVSPTAVSLRVRDLEADLGRSLFRRNGPRISLTREGGALAQRLGLALRDIRVAVDEARDESVVHVTSAPTFASRCLAPRLRSYDPRGDGGVRLESSTELKALGSFDVAVRSGIGGWAGLRSWATLPLEGTPVISPVLASRYGIGVPADLIGCPIIPDERWPAWCAMAGIDPGRLSFLPIDYPSQDLAATAAMDDAGAALLSPTLFASLLTEGRLVQPFKQVVRDDSSYHVLTTVDEERPAVLRFCKWLSHELEALNR